MMFDENKPLYEDAISKIGTILEDRAEGLKKFTKKKYPECFQQLMEKYQWVFEGMEQCFCRTESKEQMLEAFSGEFIRYAKELINTQKWKFQKEKTKADCNMFMVTYVIPMILEYEYQVSDLFAKTLLEQWNHAMGTNMTAGRYAQINSSFRTGIFGISFGEGK